MTEYLKPKFTVATPGTKSYRDNWDATFGKEIEVDERDFIDIIEVEDIDGRNFYVTRDELVARLKAYDEAEDI